MRIGLLLLATLASACAAGPEYEEPLTAAERAAFLASLPPGDREPFETLLWSREVDQRPIYVAFGRCVDKRFDKAIDVSEAGPIIDACFPTIERLVRGQAMEIPALATGPTADQLNDWAEVQADDQKLEFKALLVKRFVIRAARRAE